MKKFLLAVGALAFAAGTHAQTTIASADFEGSAQLPNGWSQTTNATDGGWLVGTATQLQSNNWPIAENGSNVAATNDDGCNCDKGSDLLLSPVMDLTSYSTVFLSLDVYFLGLTYSGAAEAGSVEISTDGGTSWTVIEQLTGTGSANQVWENKAYNISQYAGAGGGQVQVGIRYSDGGGWLYGMAVDNIMIFEPGDPDVATTSVELDPYISINNGAVSISGSLTNFGATTINQLDINFTTDGGTTLETATLSNLSIDPLTSYTYTHPIQWTPSATGLVTIDVWASNIDGNPDVNTANDEASATVLVYDQAVDRLPLHEGFTSSTCPPCQPANAAFDPIAQANAEDIVRVSFQMSWPGTGDPYYTAEGGDRRTYWGINSVPNMYVDATDIGSPISHTQAAIDAFAAVPAFVNITGTGTVDTSNHVVTVEVTADPLEDFAGTKRMMIAIVEHETFDNAKTNGETEFHNVFKKFMPDANGTSLGVLTAGNPVTVNESWTFVGDYILPPNANSPVNHGIQHTVEEFEDLGVAVWVEDPSTQEVLQAGWVDLNLVSTGEINVVESVDLYPNPSSDFTTLSVSLIEASEVKYEVLNNLGQVVLAENFGKIPSGRKAVQLDGTNLQSGVYFVNLTVGNDVMTKKLTIAK